MKKRGQANIIVTVLIILLVLVAVVIVWNVVNSSLKKSSQQISVNKFAFKGDVKYSLSPLINSVNVSVSRGAGGGNITGVRIIFEFADKTKKNYDNKTSYPNELETTVYLVTNNMLGVTNFSNLVKVSVYFIYSENNKDAYTLEIASAETSSSTCDATCMLMNSAIAWWRFEESSYSGTIGEVKDYFGRNNGIAIFYQTPASCPRPNITYQGKIGRGARFYGNGGAAGVPTFNGSYIQIPDSNLLDLNMTNFAVSFWINYTGNQGYQYPVTKSAGGGANGWGFLTSDNKVTFEIYPPNGGGRLYTTTIKRVNDSIWHQIVGVCNRTGNIDIYLDGDYQTSRNVSGNSTLGLATTNVLGIGSISYNGFFNGTLDEVIIWNRTLSASEINMIFNLHNI